MGVPTHMCIRFPSSNPEAKVEFSARVRLRVEYLRATFHAGRYFSYEEPAGTLHMFLALQCISASTKLLKIRISENLAFPMLIQVLVCYAKHSDTELEVYSSDNSSIVDVLKLAPFTTSQRKLYTWT